MAGMASLLALAASMTAAVREGGAPLRAGCSAEAGIIARLAGGAPVIIRLSISGEGGSCYKVSAGGKDGYLLREELSGLEPYDQASRGGSLHGLPETIRSEIGRLHSDLAQEASQRSASPDRTGLDPSLAQAMSLIESNQPRRALELIETALLHAAPNDPFVLSLAGLAAYQSDHTRQALDYWGQALAIRPNPSIESLYRKAHTELAADSSRARMHGSRFVLRYNEQEIGQRTAEAILAALNEEYDRLDAALKELLAQPAPG